ncbi:MAG: hypothetical protein LLG93_08025, partial [Deltaproteobacteria bacterium]|nr:hypothetical protein [Deltaproteobacteria bacterium]
SAKISGFPVKICKLFCDYSKLRYMPFRHSNAPSMTLTTRVALRLRGGSMTTTEVALQPMGFNSRRHAG